MAQVDLAASSDAGAHVGRGFELVTMFNVLDRCERPLALLTNAVDRMMPGG